jgi:hypothetical protein
VPHYSTPRAGTRYFNRTSYQNSLSGKKEAALIPKNEGRSQKRQESAYFFLAAFFVVFFLAVVFFAAFFLAAIFFLLFDGE